MPASQQMICMVDDGPIAKQAMLRLQAVLKKLNMPWSVQLSPWDDGWPMQSSAKYIIGFDPTRSHVSEAYESWPADEAQLDHEVHDLAARLFTGAKRQPRPCQQNSAVPHTEQPTVTTKPSKLPVVKLMRETKGRRGKGVTIITELPTHLTEQQLQEVATLLKNRCGTGGTVRERDIEIQGDQRDRLTIELEKLGYRVKRAGA